MDDQEWLKKAKSFRNQIEQKLSFKLPKLEKTPGGEVEHLVIAFREILLHRIYDLSDSAIELYNKNKLVPASVLTRAVFETAALLFYGLKKIITANNTKSIDEVRDLLHRGIWGSRIWDEEQKAIQVLTSLDHLDKEYHGVRSAYDNLSEMAHPNVMGTGAAYSNYDLETGNSVLGNNPELTPMAPFGLGPLTLILELTLVVHSEYILNEKTFISLLYE